MEQLFRFLNKGVTQFHVTELCRQYLEEQGFQQLSIGEDWKLTHSGRYYVMPFASELIAFTIGADVKKLRIATAHTDFPMLKLKSKPDWNKQGYHMVNVEPYGGLIMETWFDRPLGMAGKVVLKTEDAFSPEVKLYDSEKPLFVIPSLAPHLKRNEKNEKIDPQKELIPLMDMTEDTGKDRNVLHHVADTLNCEMDDILDFDLYLYNMDRVEVIGEAGKLISAPRIDNVSSVSATIAALTDEKTTDHSNLNVIALFDNEEIGSRSKQGADSIVLQSIIERILDAICFSKKERYALMQQAFLASMDVAHGLHPNYVEKSDPTNEVRLGQGVVLKSSASQRYVTDSEAAAVVLALGKTYDIQIQRQVNRSGMPGGQTLGPITASYLPIRAVDMGMPVLAMHSARELAHVEDYRQMVKLLTVIFQH